MTVLGQTNLKNMINLKINGMEQTLEAGIKKGKITFTFLKSKLRNLTM